MHDISDVGKSTFRSIKATNAFVKCLRCASYRAYNLASSSVISRLVACPTVDNQSEHTFGVVLFRLMSSSLTHISSHDLSPSLMTSAEYQPKIILVQCWLFLCIVNEKSEIVFSPGRETPSSVTFHHVVVYFHHHLPTP